MVKQVKKYPVRETNCNHIATFQAQNNEALDQVGGNGNGHEGTDVAKVLGD